MKKYNPILRNFCLSAFLFYATSVHGVLTQQEHAEEGALPPRTRAVAMLENVMRDNQAFIEEHPQQFFETFMDHQHPRMTLVGCSDSRFHTSALDRTPDNDIFVVRSIGNQLGSVRGSVKYGVLSEHLSTPLLLIVGHDNCGAVKAASAKEPKPIDIDIDRELSYVRAPRKIDDFHAPSAAGDIQHNVKYNIHWQVDQCLDEFRNLVEDGKLTIVGALYDFQSLEGPAEHKEENFGRLRIINVRDTSNSNLGSSIQGDVDFIVQSFVTEAVTQLTTEIRQASIARMEKTLGHATSI